MIKYLQLHAGCGGGGLGIKTTPLVANMNESIEKYLDHCYQKYFHQLIKKLGMAEPEKEVMGIGGYYQANYGNSVLRLTNDRGGTTFELFTNETNPAFIEISLIVNKFKDKFGITRKGYVNLNLQEQAEIIENNIDLLIEICSNEETIKIILAS